MFILLLHHIAVTGIVTTFNLFIHVSGQNFSIFSVFLETNLENSVTQSQS